MDNGQQEYARDFKGIWIPKEVWLRKDLTCMERCLLAEIDSLDTEKGCYASDTYLARILHLSVSHVANTISSLRKRKLVTTIRFNGRVRYLRTYYSQWSSSTGDSRPDLRETVEPIRIAKHITKKECDARASRASLEVNGPYLKHQQEAVIITKRFFKLLEHHRLLQGRADLPNGDSPASQKRCKNTRWKWAVACDGLIEQQEGDAQGILDVLEWYDENFKHEYVPTYKAMTTFCENFLKVKKAMLRETGESAMEDELSQRESKFPNPYL
jgi:hypothetical protein